MDGNDHRSLALLSQRRDIVCRIDPSWQNISSSATGSIASLYLSASTPGTWLLTGIRPIGCHLPPAYTAAKETGSHSEMLWWYVPRTGSGQDSWSAYDTTDEIWQFDWCQLLPYAWWFLAFKTASRGILCGTILWGDKAGTCSRQRLHAAGETAEVQVRWADLLHSKVYAVSACMS